MGLSTQNSTSRFFKRTIALQTNETPRLTYCLTTHQQLARHNTAHYLQSTRPIKLHPTKITILPFTRLPRFTRLNHLVAGSRRSRWRLYSSVRSGNIPGSGREPWSTSRQCTTIPDNWAVSTLVVLCGS